MTASWRMVQNAGQGIQIVVPIMWVGFLIHDNALLLLHELWKINDQLAGRKDEFKNLLPRKGVNED